MTICLCAICLTITAGTLAAVYAVPAWRTGAALLFLDLFFGAINLASDLATRAAARARRRPPLAWAAMLAAAIAVSSGCDLTPPRVRALPAPPPEQPVCNLPAALHVRNWEGPKGQDSCVHASLKNHAAWHNDLAFVANWPWADGEYASRVRERLDAAGYDFGYTEKYDARFLDWCDRERHGAILWWKPSHCCTFMGWVVRDGKQYAAILDNNYPGRFEIVEREQFVRLWAGYGGFALAFLKSPTISNPWLSYEVID